MSTPKTNKQAKKASDTRLPSRRIGKKPRSMKRAETIDKKPRLTYELENQTGTWEKGNTNFITSKT